MPRGDLLNLKALMTVKHGGGTNAMTHSFFTAGTAARRIVNNIGVFAMWRFVKSAAPITFAVAGYAKGKFVNTVMPINITLAGPAVWRFASRAMPTAVTKAKSSK